MLRAGASSAERIATHDTAKVALHGLVKKAGLAHDMETPCLFGKVPAAGEPAPGQHRPGVWRRIDLAVWIVSSGEGWLLDAAKPCVLTAAPEGLRARLRA